MSIEINLLDSFLSKLDLEHEKIDSPNESDDPQGALIELELRRREAELKSYIDDQKAKQWLAPALFVGLIFYIAFILYIVLGNGVDHVIHLCDVPILKNFRHDSSVLITLLGTTTANVIGLFVIVAKYFFPDR